MSVILEYTLVSVILEYTSPPSEKCLNMGWKHTATRNKLSYNENGINSKLNIKLKKNFIFLQNWHFYWYHTTLTFLENPSVTLWSIIHKTFQDRNDYFGCKPLKDYRMWKWKTAVCACALEISDVRRLIVRLCQNEQLPFACIWF